MKTGITLIFSLLLASGIYAQHYSGALAINPTDTFLLTASDLTSDGKLLTASLVRRIYVSGSPLPGQPGIGEMVIRKLKPNGQPVWEQHLTGSVGSIMHIREYVNGSLLVSGVYYDSLRFSPTEVIYAQSFRGNAFIACFDSAGNYLWEHHTMASPNYDFFYYTFDDYNGDIFIPYYENFLSGTKVQVLDVNGDSINNFQLADKILMISEFEFDPQGNLYFCGTGDPQAKIAGDRIGKDSTLFGYSTFLVKLDPSFLHDWSVTYKYVTFDMYPEMAVSSGNVALIVDTMPQTNGIGNYHMLKVFDHQGNNVYTDSVGPGFFSRMHKAIALEDFMGGFIYATIYGFDTIQIRFLDQSYKDTLLAGMHFQTLMSYPWITVNDSLALYNHSFYNEYAVINKMDSVQNSKPPGTFYSYQQLIVRFGTAQASMNIPEDPDLQMEMILYPNPYKGGLLTLSAPGFTGRESMLEIFDLSGRCVYLREFDKSGVMKLHGNPFRPGTYFVHLSDEHRAISRILIVP